MSAQYAHGNIPIPFQKAGTHRSAMSVAAIWHAYKVFENEGVDPFVFANGQPRRENDKRGKLLGWGKSHPEDKSDLLSFPEARVELHKKPYLKQIQKFCKQELDLLMDILSSGKRLILVDHSAIEDPTKDSFDKKESKLSSSWIIKSLLLNKKPKKN